MQLEAETQPVTHSMVVPRAQRRPKERAAPPQAQVDLRLFEPKGLSVAGVRVGGLELVVFSFPVRPPRLPDELSSAEKLVVESVLQGCSNQEIAEARGTSVRTVANQLQSVFRKLGLRSRGELVALIRGAR
jgi:DNA-binding NarL/FixJ family response regulator